MAKNPRKIQKQRQKKAAKNKAKKSFQKKKVATKHKSDNSQMSEKIDAALALAEEGKIKSASKIIHSLSQNHPGHPDVQYALGVMAMFGEDFNRAIEHFNHVTKIIPDHIIAHFNIAAAYQRLADIKGMATSLRKVIALQHIDSYTADVAHDRLEKLAEYVQDTNGITLDQFIKAQTYFDNGYRYMIDGHYDTAIELFKKAAVIDLTLPQPHGNMGLCYAMLGDRDKAISCLNKSLEIDPHYSIAINNLTGIKNMKPGEKLNPNHMITNESPILRALF